ncbi:MAG: hypothetical protein HC923_00120 [Myxococcales bacterium]|nr:hypothetical protein [Myxococcales bacterium]
MAPLVPAALMMTLGACGDEATTDANSVAWTIAPAAVEKSLVYVAAHEDPVLGEDGLARANAVTPLSLALGDGYRSTFSLDPLDVVIASCGWVSMEGASFVVTRQDPSVEARIDTSGERPLLVMDVRVDDDADALIRAEVRVPVTDDLRATCGEQLQDAPQLILEWELPVSLRVPASSRVRAPIACADEGRLIFPIGGRFGSRSTSSSWTATGGRSRRRTRITKLRS